MLPDISGYEVLRTLRARGDKAPVLILSGMAGVEDKVKGLGLGADDYLTKPFHKEELVARLHAVRRRATIHADNVFTMGDLKVNFDNHEVHICDKLLPLTARECAFIEVLARRPEAIATKEFVYDRIYALMTDKPEIKIVGIFLCNIRKKIAQASGGRNFIKTHWGVGYRLEECPEPVTFSYPRGPFSDLMRARIRANREQQESIA